MRNKISKEENETYIHHCFLDNTSSSFCILWHQDTKRKKRNTPPEMKEKKNSKREMRGKKKKADLKNSFVCICEI